MPQDGIGFAVQLTEADWADNLSNRSIRSGGVERRTQSLPFRLDFKVTMAVFGDFGP